MFTFENTKKIVTFEHNGKCYTMTEEEVEAAFRYRHHQYQLMDAERALSSFIFGYDYADFELAELEDAEAVESFEAEYKISIRDAHDMIEDYLAVYRRYYKTEGDSEHNQWMLAIASVLRSRNILLILKADNEVIGRRLKVKDVADIVAKREGWNHSDAVDSVFAGVVEMLFNGYVSGVMHSAGFDHVYRIELLH